MLVSCMESARGSSKVLHRVQPLAQCYTVVQLEVHRLNVSGVQSTSREVHSWEACIGAPSVQARLRMFLHICDCTEAPYDYDISCQLFYCDEALVILLLVCWNIYPNLKCMRIL